MVDRDLQAQFKGWSLTTAEIMYRMPDYRDLLQTFIWQNYDIAPRFPVLIKFVEFWKAKLEGPLHSVMHGRYLRRRTLVVIARGNFLERGRGLAVPAPSTKADIAR